MDLRVIRDNITIEQVYELMQELNIYVEYLNEETLLLETACHNHLGQGSHKLYYYANNNRDTSPFFTCYTGCGTFDLIEFIQRHYKTEFYQDLTMQEAADIIVKNTQGAFQFINKNKIQYTPLNKREYKKPTIKTYNKSILDNFRPAICMDWIKESISPDTQKFFNIRFNPIDMAVIIPSYDIKNNLISIRERFLVEDEIQYGKYRPLTFRGTTYSTPTSYSLFGINYIKDNIKKHKKAVILEGEKSCMLSYEYFKDNSLILAMQGSAFSRHHLEQLKELGVEEVVIGYDKQFKNKNEKDEEFVSLLNKMKKINDMSTEIKFSFIMDEKNILSYKDAPIDKGKENFIKLYNNRKPFDYFENKYSNCFVYKNGNIEWKSIYDF